MKSFNLFLGHTTESMDFWSMKVKMLIENYFKNAMTDVENQCTYDLRQRFENFH